MNKNQNAGAANAALSVHVQREIRDRMQQASMLLQAGRLAQADHACQEVLKRNPQEPQAWYFRGVIAYKGQKYAEAVAFLQETLRLEPRNAQGWRALAGVHMAMEAFSAAAAAYSRAIEINPADAGGYFNLGIALEAVQDPVAAVQAYGQALQLQPSHWKAAFNRGLACQKLGDHPGAVASYDQVLHINPQVVDACLNKGISLHQLERYGEALACYQSVLDAAPLHAEARYHSANALNELRQHDRAIDSYDQAISLGYARPEVYLNKASAHIHHGDPQAAIRALDAALEIDPDYAQAYDMLSVAHRRLRQFDVAAQYASHALQLQPGHAAAHNNRGLALQAMGQDADALACFDAALQVDAGLTDALFNRGQSLARLHRQSEAVDTFAALLEKSSTYPYALGYLVHARLHRCQWDHHGSDVLRLQQSVREGVLTDTPFSFLSASATQADELLCAKRFAQDRFPAQAPLWTGDSYRHSRIRVAYVSADFHDHATAFLMAELFELHDRDAFEIHAFSYGGQRTGAMRQRLERGFDHFFEVGHLTDLQIAQQIRSYEIDILVDLKGYTQDCRLGILACRPAPVQVSYLGYPGTLGVEYVDYIVGDTVVTPFEHAAYYTEKIVQLPGSYQVNDRQRAVAPETPSRAAAGLPAEGFVFCCFNNNYKITPGMFDIWMRLLAQVEGSVLWLLQDNDEAAANLRKEAAARGIDPTRLVFAARMGLPEHLARQRLADLFLDTLPYNAHTTCSDALWVGLPVLTCLGHSFAGRVAASLLRAADMPELICEDLAAYEARALQLATHPEELRGLRTRLEQGRLGCALFDTDRFRRGLEQAFQVMHARQRDGMAPQGFAVAHPHAQALGG